MVRSKWIVAAVFSVCLMLGCWVSASADDRDHDRKCEQKIHKAEDSLSKAVAKHGEHSRQAESKRHDLEAARARCGHDHDHDHDHDHN